jgi:uncharacterized protein (DUF924 family)
LQLVDAKDPRAAQVLRFWFGSGRRDKRWFKSSAAFDREIGVRFLALHEEAAAGVLAHWERAPAECLALIVLLDQFPRNMFRGTAGAFATDPLALVAAMRAVADGFEGGMPPLERMFVYLPFQHAESLPEQEKACELTRSLVAFPETADAYRYAKRHRDIIARFGRFPHRNAVLGRVSTPEETKFLQEPGSSF